MAAAASTAAASTAVAEDIKFGHKHAGSALWELIGRLMNFVSLDCQSNVSDTWFKNRQLRKEVLCSVDGRRALHLVLELALSRDPAHVRIPYPSQETTFAQLLLFVPSMSLFPSKKSAPQPPAILTNKQILSRLAHVGNRVLSSPKMRDLFQMKRILPIMNPLNRRIICHFCRVSSSVVEGMGEEKPNPVEVVTMSTTTVSTLSGGNVASITTSEQSEDLPQGMEIDNDDSSHSSCDSDSDSSSCDESSCSSSSDSSSDSDSDSSAGDESSFLTFSSMKGLYASLPLRHDIVSVDIVSPQDLMPGAFRRPFLVASSSLAGLKLPKFTSPLDVVNVIPDDKIMLEAFESSSSESMMELSQRRKMSLRTLQSHFRSKARGSSVINILDFEVSHPSLSSLGDEISPPNLVSDADILAPFLNKTKEEWRVSKYIIMSEKGSVTQTHSDVAGCAVWFSCLSGRKKLYLIEPTRENVYLYFQWRNENRSNGGQQKIFADYLKSNGKTAIIYSCDLTKGQSLFVPPGWLHAVMTLEESVTIAGNFWPRYTFKVALYQLSFEPDDENLPLFAEMGWYTAMEVCRVLRDNNNNKILDGEAARDEVLSLAHTLAKWTKGKEATKDRCICLHDLFFLLKQGAVPKRLHQMCNPNKLCLGSFIYKRFGKVLYCGIVVDIDRLKGTMQKVCFVVYPDGDCETIDINTARKLAVRSRDNVVLGSSKKLVNPCLSMWKNPTTPRYPKPSRKKLLFDHNRQVLKSIQGRHASELCDSSVDFFQNSWLVTDLRNDNDGGLPTAYNIKNGSCGVLQRVYIQRSTKLLVYGDQDGAKNPHYSVVTSGLAELEGKYPAQLPPLRICDGKNILYNPNTPFVLYGGGDYKTIQGHCFYTTVDHHLSKLESGNLILQYLNSGPKAKPARAALILDGGMNTRNANGYQVTPDGNRPGFITRPSCDHLNPNFQRWSYEAKALMSGHLQQSIRNYHNDQSLQFFPPLTPARSEFLHDWNAFQSQGKHDLDDQCLALATTLVAFTTMKPCQHNHNGHDKCKNATNCVGPYGDWIKWYSSNRMVVPLKQREAIDLALASDDDLEIEVSNGESFIDLAYHNDELNGVDDGDNWHTTAAKPLSLSNMSLGVAICLIAHGHRTNHLMMVNVSYGRKTFTTMCNDREKAAKSRKDAKQGPAFAANFIEKLLGDPLKEFYYNLDFIKNGIVSHTQNPENVVQRKEYKLRIVRRGASCRPEGLLNAMLMARLVLELTFPCIPHKKCVKLNEGFCRLTNGAWLLCDIVISWCSDSKDIMEEKLYDPNVSMFELIREGIANHPSQANNSEATTGSSGYSRNQFFCPKELKDNDDFYNALELSRKKAGQYPSKQVAARLSQELADALMGLGNVGVVMANRFILLSSLCGDIPHRMFNYLTNHKKFRKGPTKFLNQAVMNGAANYKNKTTENDKLEEAMKDYSECRRQINKKISPCQLEFETCEGGKEYLHWKDKGHRATPCTERLKHPDVFLVMPNNDLQLLFLVKEASVNNETMDIVVFHSEGEIRKLHELRVPPFLDPNLSDQSVPRRPWASDRNEAKQWVQELLDDDGHLRNLPPSGITVPSS